MGKTVARKADPDLVQSCGKYGEVARQPRSRTPACQVIETRGNETDAICSPSSPPNRPPSPARVRHRTNFMGGQEHDPRRQCASLGIADCCADTKNRRGCAHLAKQREMASSKSWLISPRYDTRGRVARGSSSGTQPIPRGPAHPPPAISGHTSYASSGTAPSRSTVLTIQSAVEEMRKKLL